MPFGPVADGAGRLDDRLESRLLGNRQTTLEEPCGQPQVRLPVAIPEGLLHALRFGQCRMTSGDLRPLPSLLGGEVLWVVEEDGSRPLHRLVLAPLRTAHPLNSIAEKPCDMEAIEGHLGLG